MRLLLLGAGSVEGLASGIIQPKPNLATLNRCDPLKPENSTWPNELG